MKKILPFIAVVLFLFTACNKDREIFGGRYYGTFYNTTNHESESGSLSFAFGKYTYFDEIIKIDTIIGSDSLPIIDTISLSIGGSATLDFYQTTYIHDTFVSVIHKIDTTPGLFLLNHLVKLEQDKKDTKTYIIPENKPISGTDLKRLLETMPFIDKLQICDPAVDSIKSMYLEAKFTSNNVESKMTFVTFLEKKVNVTFTGSLFQSN